MVENLSDFLRAGLAIDPSEDIPLAKEIELQSTYLAIEAVRFPNRLVVDDRRAGRRSRPRCVPSLIIQPLVENAVRHAVAVSTAPVRLTIAAHAEGRRAAHPRARQRRNGGRAASGDRRAPASAWPTSPSG